MHNPRRPLDRLTLTTTLTLTLTFDLIILVKVGGRGIVIDYLCAKFSDFSYSRFRFNVRTDRQTDRITDADERYTHATTVGVSNKIITVIIVTSENYPTDAGVILLSVCRCAKVSVIYTIQVCKGE